MISKIAIPFIRTFNRSKVNQIITKLPTQFTFAPIYQFNALEKVEKANGQLIKALEREIKYENENYQKDETIKEFLKENGFSLIETDSDFNVQIVKQVGELKVSICFQSRSPQTQDNPEVPEGEKDAAQTPEQQQQDQMQDGSDYCDFTVYVQKGSKQNVLAFECSSVDNQINITGVHIIQDAEAHKKAPRFFRNLNEYSSPDFTNLDERMQTAMLEYLKSVGVTEEVAAFVEHYSLDKEQRLYMKWLKDIKEYTE